MLKLCSRLWHDENAFVVSAELILICTLGVLGVVVGLRAVSDAVVGELTDLGRAIASVDQSYGVSGIRLVCGHGGGYSGCCQAYQAGFGYTDWGGDGDCALVTDIAPCVGGGLPAPAPALPAPAPPIVAPSAPPTIPCPPPISVGPSASVCPDATCPPIGTVPAPAPPCECGPGLPPMPSLPPLDAPCPDGSCFEATPFQAPAPAPKSDEEVLPSAPVPVT